MSSTAALGRIQWIIRISHAIDQTVNDGWRTNYPQAAGLLMAKRARDAR